MAPAAAAEPGSPLAERAPSAAGPAIAPPEAASLAKAAPPAVRLTLPEANPTLSITAALAITFPFNIAFGIPIYYEMAKWLGAT